MEYLQNIDWSLIFIISIGLLIFVDKRFDLGLGRLDAKLCSLFNGPDMTMNSDLETDDSKDKQIKELKARIEVLERIVTDTQKT